MAEVNEVVAVDSLMVVDCVVDDNVAVGCDRDVEDVDCLDNVVEVRMLYGVEDVDKIGDKIVIVDFSEKAGVVDVVECSDKLVRGQYVVVVVIIKILQLFSSQDVLVIVVT